MSAPFFYTPKLKYFVPGTGNPAANYWVKTFAAGTSNPLALWQDQNLTVPQANPFQLDANGEMVVYGSPGVAYKAQLLFTDGATPIAGENVDGILVAGAPTTSNQWQSTTGLGFPTYVSATSFTLPGNVTSVFTLGTAIQTFNNGGTTYSIVASSTYNSGPNTTTITVNNLSGVLDAGLSVVNVNLITASNGAIPGRSAVSVTFAHNTEVFVTATALTLDTTNGVALTGNLPGAVASNFSEFAVATGLFTATRPGYYLLNANVNIFGSGVTFNGASYLTTFGSAGSPSRGNVCPGVAASLIASASVAWLEYMTAGQTVGLQAFLTFSAGAPTISGGQLTIAGPL